LQFEVKGKQYFLGFVAEEGKWFVFTPGTKGVHRIPVVDDEALPFVGGVVIDDVDLDRKRT
jgi:hypothetical protein